MSENTPHAALCIVALISVRELTVTSGYASLCAFGRESDFDGSYSLPVVGSNGGWVRERCIASDPKTKIHLGDTGQHFFGRGVVSGLVSLRAGSQMSTGSFSLV